MRKRWIDGNRWSAAQSKRQLAVNASRTPLLRGADASVPALRRPVVHRAPRKIRAQIIPQCFEEVLRVLRVCEPEQGAGKPEMVKLGARHNASAASARLVEMAHACKGGSQQGVTCPPSSRLGREVASGGRPPSSNRACGMPRAWGVQARHAPGGGMPLARRDPPRLRPRRNSSDECKSRNASVRKDLHAQQARWRLPQGDQSSSARET